MDKEKFLDISWVSVLKVSVAITAFYFLYTVKEIVVWFIFAIIISILFNPVIVFLKKRGIPRIVGVIFSYLTVVGAIILFVYLTIPFFISEIRQLLQIFPSYFEKFSSPLTGMGFEQFESIDTLTKTTEDFLKAISSNIFAAIFSIFGGVFVTFFVLTTAIFLSMEDKMIEKALILIFPKRYEATALNIWERSQKKVSGWFVARLIACLFVGIASYIVFRLFNVNYPFVLALLAGVLNFIPYIGPIFTGALLFLLIFPLDVLKAIFVIVAFLIIQQIEGSILSPILMKKFINLPPSLVLLSLIIGAKLWGFLGALLVIPLAGILFEFTKEFLQKRKEKESAML